MSKQCTCPKGPGGISTPANIAVETVLGNPPCQVATLPAFTVERILELAAEHEFGGAADGDVGREHCFRTDDLCPFVWAIQAEICAAIAAGLTQAHIAMDQAGAILSAIEDRAMDKADDGNSDATFHHLEMLARIGADLLDRGANDLCALLFAAQQKRGVQ